jgi:polar amino acid transport system substrate-binding protein
MRALAGSAVASSPEQAVRTSRPLVVDGFSRGQPMICSVITIDLTAAARLPRATRSVWQRGLGPAASERLPQGIDADHCDLPACQGIGDADPIPARIHSVPGIDLSSSARIIVGETGALGRRNRIPGRKHMSSLLSLLRKQLLLIFALFALMAQASPTVAEDPFAVINRIKHSGTLNFPVMLSEEPGYIKDPRTGEWSGFYVDFGKQIAGLLGVKVNFVETTWGNLAADFQASKIDLAIGLNPNPQRGLVVDYIPGSIVEGIWGIIARPGFEPKTWRDLDRKEVRIAVQQGSTMQVIAEAVIPNATAVIVPTRDQAILEMQSQRVDAILLSDQDVAQLHAQGIGKAIVPMPVLRNPMTIGIRREAGNEGYANFLANWMSQQNALGLACSRITQYMLKRHIDMSVVPQSGKYC